MVAGQIRDVVDENQVLLRAANRACCITSAQEHGWWLCGGTIPKCWLSGLIRLAFELWTKNLCSEKVLGLEDDFPIEPLHFFVSNMRVGLWISPKNPAILRVWLVLNVLNPWFSLHFSGTRSPGWRAFEAFALGAREGSSTWTSPWEAVWSVKIRSWSCVARVFQWFWPVHLPQRIVFIMLFRRDTHMSHFHRTGFDFSSDSLRSEQLTFTFVSRHISWQHLLLHDDIECSWL